MHQYFLDSINTKRKIEIIYLSKNNKTTQRIIRVIKIEENKILAFCFMKRQVRVFIMENILAAYPFKKGIIA